MPSQTDLNKDKKCPYCPFTPPNRFLGRIGQLEAGWLQVIRRPSFGTLREAAVARAKFPHSFLLPGPRAGRALMSIRRHFPAAVKAAGLKYGRKHPDGITFHTYRHSMASLALNAGVPKSTVQRMGNWKSPAMVNRYAHLADETLRSAAKKLDALVEKGSGRNKPESDCSEPTAHYAA